MPVYEYQCQACRQDFEYQQRMSDPEMTTCEACGGALERLISRTAFALKGSGWYKDLYASAKPANQASDGKADGAADAKANGKSTDSAAASADKPAAKSSDTKGGSGSSNGTSGTSSGSSSSSSSSGSTAKAS